MILPGPLEEIPDERGITVRAYLTAAIAAVAAVIMAPAGIPAAAATPVGKPAGPASALYVDNQISGTVTPISTAANPPGAHLRSASTRLAGGRSERLRRRDSMGS
jgi:hypothetical protein